MIPRLSSNDLAERAADVGPDPRLIGAAVEVDGPLLDIDHIRDLVAGRLGEAPLLTRRACGVPWGCGRPVWQDVTPDLAVHVRAATCPEPGDRHALLDLAARLAAEDLPHDRPRWRLCVVDGIAGGASALIWLSDHAAADGPSTLSSVLTVLGTSPGEHRGASVRPRVRPSATDVPALPGRGALMRDTAIARLRSLARLPHGLLLLAAGARELAASAGRRAPRTVLNRPIEAGFRLVVADVALEPLRAGARTCGATVNDAVLCAVGRTMHAELARRGDPVEQLLISCPVTVPVPAPARGRAALARPQNLVGVVRMAVPAPGPVGPDELRRHLTRVAELSRPRKRHLSAASTLVLSPAFRALAALRLYRPLVDHQRTMNALVTNLRGPQEQVTLAGRTVRGVVPVSPVVGNVPLAVTALSFGGRLSVTLRLAPSLWAAGPHLREEVQAELAAICDLVTDRPAP